MLAGNDVVIRRYRDDTIKIDGNVIESCDLTASNGVVHALAGTLEVEEDDSDETPSFFDSLFEDFDVDVNFREVLPDINMVNSPPPPPVNCPPFLQG